MATFKAFRRFNQPELHRLVRVRRLIGRASLDYFPSSGLPDRIVRSMAARRAVAVKEAFESFEFFERVRRRMKAPVVADLCCGHGLTGILFAVFEPRVERVILLDHRCPASYPKILEAVADIAPWIKEKVTYIEDKVERASRHLPRNTSIIAVHACGVRTDRCIDAAIDVGSNLAVMPCCYAQTAVHAPKILRKKLGRPLSTDIHRTYRLESAGYRVDWSEIPVEITPMNRILVGMRSLEALC